MKTLIIIASLLMAQGAFAADCGTGYRYYDNCETPQILDTKNCYCVGNPSGTLECRWICPKLTAEEICEQIDRNLVAAYDEWDKYRRESDYSYVYYTTKMNTLAEVKVKYCTGQPE